MSKQEEIEEERKLDLRTQRKLDQDWKEVEEHVGTLMVISVMANDPIKLSGLILEVPATAQLLSCVCAMVSAQAIMNQKARRNEDNG